jgi:hypothetical protein
MCTLIVLHRCFDEAPLVVAANRDEYLDRPAQAPALRTWNGRRVLAPIDQRAGGTWLGLNDAGVFVAVTNRPTAKPDPARRSRGLLVADMLAHTSALAVAQDLLELGANLYNPFNIVAVDARDAFAVTYDEKPRAHLLPPGAHVIGNADPNATHVPKIARLLARAERIAEGPADAALGALASLCRGHDGGESPLAHACIHAGAYGTHSSTLLLRGAGGADALQFASGAPCRTAYEDLTPLLAQLGTRVPGFAEAASRNEA